MFKFKKIFWLLPLVSLFSLTTLSFNPLKASNELINNENNLCLLSNQKSSDETTINTNELNQPIKNNLRNILNDTNGDSNLYVPYLKEAFLEIVTSVYDNLNIQFNDETSIKNGFDVSYVRTEINTNYSNVILKITIQNPDVLKNPNNKPLDDFTINEFTFTNFYLPLPSEKPYITLKDGNNISEIAPHQIDATNFSQYFDISYNRQPSGGNQITYKFSYDNIDGIFKVKSLIMSKAWGSSDYNEIVNNQEFDINQEFSDFRNCVPTNINGLVLPITSVDTLAIRKSIFEYVQEQKMLPLDNSLISFIDVDTSIGNNQAKVTFKAYYNENGEYIKNANNQIEQIINLDKSPIKVTHIDSQINAISSFQNKITPYEIVTRYKNNDSSITNSIKQNILIYISNPNGQITTNDIEIIGINDINVVNNARINIDFKLINNKGIDENGAVNEKFLSTTIINLFYQPTQISLKSNLNLKTKAADYINTNNWSEYIEITNPLYGAKYEPRDFIPNYTDAVETIYFSATKYVDNNGNVIDKNQDITITASGFAKVPITQIGWINTNQIPFSVAADEKYLQQYFQILNKSAYDNIMFKNNQSLIPTISNLSIDEQNDDGTLKISYTLDNFISKTGILVKQEVFNKELIPGLATYKAFVIEEDANNLNDDNVYDNIYVQPLILGYLNLPSKYTGSELKKALNDKLYEFKVINEKVYLYKNNISLGIIDKAKSIGTKNTLEDTFIIVLIVGGSITIVLIIVFVILWICFGKKRKNK